MSRLKDVPLLYKIEVLTPMPNLRQVSESPDFFLLAPPVYKARYHTTDGVWELCLLEGWITD